MIGSEKSNRRVGGCLLDDVELDESSSLLRRGVSGLKSIVEAVISKSFGVQMSLVNENPML